MQGEYGESTQRDLDRVALIVAVLFAVVAACITTRSVTSAGSSPWVPVVPAVVSMLISLICNRRCRYHIVWHNREMAMWLISVGACFSICAGVSVSVLLESDNPVVAAMFCASSMVVLDMALMTLRVHEPMVRGVVNAMLFVAMLMTMASAATMLFDLPEQLLAGLMVAAAICSIQIMPNIVVHVPDRYLMEWRTYMTRRWTVRGDIPEKARVLNREDIHRDMDGFIAQYATGVTLCVALSLSGYAVLAERVNYHSLYDRIGFLIVSAGLMLFFMLKPRQSVRPFERYLMRIAAIIIPLLWIRHASEAVPEVGAMLPFICMIVFAALGVLLGFSMIAQHNGFHSLVLSRIGDALCFSSTMVIPVASFLAGGALELLRSMSW